MNIIERLEKLMTDARSDARYRFQGIEDCHLPMHDTTLEVIADRLAAIIAEMREQKPVAWRTYDRNGWYVFSPTKEEAMRDFPGKEHFPVYAAPPAPQQVDRNSVLEEAAKVCEVQIDRDPEYGGRFGGYGPWKGNKTGPECAAAIRALKEPQT